MNVTVIMMALAITISNGSNDGAMNDNATGNVKSGSDTYCDTSHAISSNSMSNNNIKARLQHQYQ